MHVMHNQGLRMLPLLGVLLLLLLAGCVWEPDRDNVSDPGSDLWRDEGDLSVHVRTYAVTDLPGARVTVLETGRIDTTDESGWAYFTAPLDTLTLRAELEGYSSRDTTVTVQYNEDNRVLISLNAIPRVDSARVISAIEDSSLQASAQDYILIARAWVRDNDGNQIDTVIFRDHNGLEYGMVSQNGSDLYTFERNFGEFGRDSLAIRVGKSMLISTLDDRGGMDALNTHLSSFLSYNNLHTDMSVMSPQVSGDNPVFYWNLPDPDVIDFRPLRYEFELFFGQNLIRGPIEVLNDSTVSLEPITTDEQYRWRLTLYDPFGSYSKSAFRPIQVD